MSDNKGIKSYMERHPELAEMVRDAEGDCAPVNDAVVIRFLETLRRTIGAPLSWKFTLLVRDPHNEENEIFASQDTFQDIREAIERAEARFAAEAGEPDA